LNTVPENQPLFLQEFSWNGSAEVVAHVAKKLIQRSKNYKDALASNLNKHLIRGSMCARAWINAHWAQKRILCDI
jgi:hypothetical protein